MGVPVTGASALHWCHHQVPYPPPPPAAASAAGHSTGISAASVFSSISSKKFAPIHAGGEREKTVSFLLGAASTSLFRSRSFEAVATATRRRRRSLRRTLRSVSSASLDCLNGDEGDEEFAQRIPQWPRRAQQQQREKEAGPWAPPIIHPARIMCGAAAHSSSISSFSSIPIPPPVSPPVAPGGTHEPIVEPVPPTWIVPAVVEKNANRVGLPLSLRIIKEKKKRREDGIWEEVSGDSSDGSMKKAFSSMVFIVRELQIYNLKLRQDLFYEDPQGIPERVQREMSASFVWLFQQIFSCTPTLMVSVMLLLADFTVYSIGHGSSIAAPTTGNPPARAATTVTESQREGHHRGCSRFARAAAKTFSVGGSDGKTKPVPGTTDDGRHGEFSRSSYRTALPDGSSSSSVPGAVDNDGVAVKDHRTARSTEEEEARIWKDVLADARRMKANTMDEALLDADVLRRFVSPVTVELLPEDYSDYSTTEFMYQQAVQQEPDNALLLANFAQFLFLVRHDHDRAEYYFKRAVGVQPADAEALSRYASFLWLSKKDLTAAEETYLEAIAADPGNTVHATNYALFLWNTGGEDTCFPLDGGEGDDDGDDA